MRTVTLVQNGPSNCEFILLPEVFEGTITTLCPDLQVTIICGLTLKFDLLTSPISCTCLTRPCPKVELYLTYDLHCDQLVLKSIHGVDNCQRSSILPGRADKRITRALVCPNGKSDPSCVGTMGR